MQNYLFVHFKERRTPEGEQVYFGLSRDGYTWEAVNGGNPVLWSMIGEKGVRDCTVIRSDNGRFYIIATDLSLSYNMRRVYRDSWKNVQLYGSSNLMMWESEDLVHWSAQKELPVRKPGEGCCWAPDIIQDKNTGEYIIHWSSPNKYKNMEMSIYYVRTRDFEIFSEPAVLYEKDDCGVIDSCMVEEKGIYYLWVKSDRNPCGVIMLKSDCITGPFERVPEFDREMSGLAGGSGAYEAPTACRLEDGSYCLMLDYFGVPGKGQGYVPFLTSDISGGVFRRSDQAFSYPYGFKHGTILPITEEEYHRIREFDFEEESFNR